MKRRLATAGICGLAVLLSAVRPPAGAGRAMFAATLAPVLLALIVPFGLPERRCTRKDALFAVATGFAGALALLPFLGGGPEFAGAFGIGTLLTAWTALLIGLFRLGSRGGAGLGHLLASGLGLLYCATHLLADPVVIALGENKAVRHAFLRAALDFNPSLMMSAAFWEFDLLHSSWGYARSEIGSFHGYTYGKWGWTALAYVVAGVLAWALGRRAPAADAGPESASK